MLLMTPLILCLAVAQPKWMAYPSIVIFHTAILIYSSRSPVLDTDYSSCGHKCLGSPSQLMDSLRFPRLPSRGSHQASIGLISSLAGQWSPSVSSPQPQGGPSVWDSRAATYRGRGRDIDTYPGEQLAFCHLLKHLAI